jgi:hypothetical protein
MMGKKVDIMPMLQEDDPLRAAFFFASIGFKCPNLRIDGVLWEVEKSSNSLKVNNLKYAIDEGTKQAHYVIVNLSYHIDRSFMYRIIKGRFKDHENLRAVEFRYKGKYTLFCK